MTDNKTDKKYRFDIYPKINTTQMDKLLPQITNAFENVKSLPLWWICGRKQNFGFRPSFTKLYLEGLTKKWLSLLKDNIVITPIVFYTCDKKNIELTTPDNEKDVEDFHVYHHYNILISWVENNIIHIERYEPSNINYQGNLDTKLKDLFVNTLRKYTTKDVKYELISPTGLQNKTKDKTLCGHHILFYVIYRLKYGKEKTQEQLNTTNDVNKFKSFCECMTEYTMEQD